VAGGAPNTCRRASGIVPPTIDRIEPLPDRQAATRTIDTSSLACPLPVLKARKALIAMAPGERLALIATDPLAALDIPHFCKEAGHRLIESRKQGDALYFLIERGDDRANGDP
jgi:tRNA 2-thiouridine synthesizing protein A